MFWQVQGNMQISPIDEILESGSFSLETLLLEENVIQEVKSMNDDLINFLSQPDVVMHMVSYVIDPLAMSSLLLEASRHRREIERQEARELQRSAEAAEMEEEEVATEAEAA
eukprot:CAMPEP_0198236788 /NCGR_PEP_ID=MMETSP1446-20131203/2679_1 /TAXON_ID=1461542 ORGANISM="Unidentified sp, Strain CCMP2111" /NCGR_SAMPLE_ID=MMETSP1446 /ASSEMBLY_ACC=CAM_ASM_001112 /LENGTH=111 /DNA_ID=CAMNT_0043918723 /DNA_START=105 /DNA_END=436 /DNA_ORIENTATION=+